MSRRLGAGGGGGGSGVPTPGPAGTALISTGTSFGWASDFGAQLLKTTGGLQLGPDAGSGAGAAASAGGIRLPKDVGVLATINGRRNDDAADVRVLQWVSAGAALNMGDSSGTSGLNCHVSAAGVFTVLCGGNGRFQVGNVNVGILTPGLTFDASVLLPVLSQATTGSATGQAMLMHSQDAATTGAELGVRPGAGGTGGELWLGKGSGSKMLRINDTGLAYYGAAPVAKPTVTGSKGANAALASLLTALASLGLITDSST